MYRGEGTRGGEKKSGKYSWVGRESAAGVILLPGTENKAITKKKKKKKIGFDHAGVLR